MWLLLVVAAGCKDEPPANEVRASGHVEATTVRVAPEIGGRIILITAREGDRVTPGMLLARLDTREIELTIERVKAERAQAHAQLRLLQAGTRREDIRQAEAELAAARDELSAAQAELASAEADLQRFESLLQANAGSRKQRDDALTRRNVTRERVQAATSRIRAGEQVVAKLEAGARPEEIEAARARVTAIDAQVAVAEKNLADAALTAPIGGVITDKLAEAGEVIAPRSPILVITNLTDAWADVYVPEPVVPRIRIGQSASVFTDAGGSGLAGSVSYISPKAEFTPRNVQTADDRSKLVYRVRIAVDNKEGILKEGMPVEATIPLAPLAQN